LTQIEGRSMILHLSRPWEIRGRGIPTRLVPRAPPDRRFQRGRTAQIAYCPCFRSKLERAMRPMPYLIISAVIFSVVALLHLLRLALGWSMVIAGWPVPFWLSWLALVVLAALILIAIRLIRQAR